jgi:hypothetical protein
MMAPPAAVPRLTAPLLLLAALAGCDSAVAPHAARSTDSRRWSEPFAVEPGPGVLGTEEQVRAAADANGNALVVWVEGTLGDSVVRARRFVAGRGWHDAHTIGHAGPSAGEPIELALDASGNAVAVWRAIGGGEGRLWANRFDARTGSWGLARRVDTTGRAIRPALAVSPSGQATVVWREGLPDMVTSHVYASRSAPDREAWDPPLRIDAAAAAQALWLDVATNAAGRTVAVWAHEAYPSGAHTLWVATHDGSAWRAALQVPATGLRSVSWPVALVDDVGDAGIVFGGFDEDHGWQIYLLVLDGVSGTSDGPVAMSEDPGGYAIEPQVALFGEDGLVVAWSQLGGDPERSGVWAVWSSGDSVAGPERISPGGESVQLSRLAVEPDGRALVAWASSAQPDRSVPVVRRYDPGAGWREAESLEPAAAGTRPYAIDLATGGDGSVLAVWRRHTDGVGSAVWGSRLD